MDVILLMRPTELEVAITRCLVSHRDGRQRERNPRWIYWPATLMTLPLVHWSDVSRSVTFKMKHELILDVTPAKRKGHRTFADLNLETTYITC